MTGGASARVLWSNQAPVYTEKTALCYYGCTLCSHCVFKLELWGHNTGCIGKIHTTFRIQFLSLKVCIPTGSTYAYPNLFCTGVVRWRPISKVRKLVVPPLPFTFCSNCILTKPPEDTETRWEKCLCSLATILASLTIWFKQHKAVHNVGSDTTLTRSSLPLVRHFYKFGVWIVGA